MEQIIQNAYTFISNFLSMIKLNDVVDILLVAYILYVGLKLVRETRAMQLVRGIILLILATWLSGVFNFNTLNFILRNTMQVGVVALLVVFQPEFRRALEKVGRTSFTNVFNDDESADLPMIKEVVDAVEIMSQERIGALIVFERETKIGDIIRTGTQLDAVTSSGLLINIFVPNTPLHDGAVVIGNTRVKAAGCLLPLTQNENLSRELGTRHRAAIGITENSDCVVVVVSEETGKISFAKDGSLTRNLTGETLSKALYRALAADEGRDSVTKRQIKKWRERLKWQKK